MNHNFESNLVLMIRESEWDARFDSSYFLNQRTNQVFKDNGKITIKLSIQEFVESCELFLGKVRCAGAESVKRCVGLINGGIIEI